jgi:hypothetical protein
VKKERLSRWQILCVLALFVGACGSDDPTPVQAEIDAGADAITDVVADTTAAPDVAVPDAGELADTAVAPDVPAPEQDITVPDVPDVSPPCVVEGDFVDWTPECTESGAPIVLQAGTEPIDALALGSSAGAHLIAWGSGGTVMARIVDDAGADQTGDLVIGGSPEPVTGLEIVPSPQGFMVFFTSGGTLFSSLVAADGSILLEATLTLDDVVLQRGSTLGSAGYRLWGVRESVDDLTGEPFTVALLLRISTAGEVEGTHFMQNAANYSYMRLHADETLVHVPYMATDPEHRLNYFLAGITQPGCGLPEDADVPLGADGRLVGSAYLEGEPIWIAHQPGECPEGSGQVFVHNTLLKTTRSAALSIGPSDQAEVLAYSEGGFVVVDALGGDLRAVRVQPSKLIVSKPVVLHATGDVVADLRVAETPLGFLVAWRGTSEAGVHRVALAPGCP